MKNTGIHSNLQTKDGTPPRASGAVADQSMNSGESGFTLIEVSIGLVIIMVALLGVAFSLTYVINYNAGNNSRSQALAVLQQEVERMRAAKFTPTTTDPSLLGGTRADRLVASPGGSQFTVSISVDNNPLTAGIQDEAAAPNSTLKEVGISVRLASPSPGWQTAIPATIILRRVRAN
jgi:type II secretory pathway pseudopilin PulG